MGASPQVVDWNLDGKQDLICGDADGYLNVFIRRDSGLEAFYKYPLLDGNPLKAGAQSVPAVCDWSRDGRRDLVFGRGIALMPLYLNQGADTWPMFQSSSWVMANGTYLVLPRTSPAVVDLDQDGKQDLITSEMNGFVHFFRNVGSDTNPTLTRAETLRTVAGMPIKPSGVSFVDGKIGMGDWNNDGVVDLLISGAEGLVDLYLGVPLTGTEEASSLDLRTSSLRIEPNPARGQVVIRIPPTAGHSDLRLFDASGREVITHFIPSSLNHVTLDLRKLSIGAYLVRLKNGGFYGTQKLVVQR